jgi:hypothetical protein
MCMVIRELTSDVILSRESVEESLTAVVETLRYRSG